MLHGHSVQAGEMIDFCALLAGFGPDTLSQLSGVSSGRLATLPIAAEVMRAVMERSRIGRVVFSAFGLREGVIFDQLPQVVREEDPLIAACVLVSGLTPRFPVNGDTMLAWLDPLFAGESEAHRRLRLAAGLLSDIGWRVHPDYRGDHAMAEILRAPIVGLDHADRIRLALAVRARYTHKGMVEAVEPYRALVGETDADWASRVGQGLRLAHTVSGGVPEILRMFQLELRSSHLVLHCLPDAPEPVEPVVMSRLRRLADTFGRSGLYLPAG